MILYVSGVIAGVVIGAFFAFSFKIGKTIVSKMKRDPKDGLWATHIRE